MSRCNIHFIGCLSSLTHPLIRNKMSSMNGNGSLSMEKILNISGAPTLSEVTCLDISGLELKTKDLKVLLSLSQLEELNVSDNDLKGFPVDLTLPKLRKLNCSKNVLRSVDFVTQFPKLEVLLIESNIVNICEQYIAIHVLPSLVEYNGEATKEVRQIIEEYEYRLLQRLSDTWNEQFAILLPCQFSALEANHIERKLRRDLQNVPCGPSSLQHFKDHLIFHIVRRHMLKIKIEQSEIKQEKRKMKSNHDGIKKKIKLESVSDNGLSSTKKNKIHGSGLSHSSFVPVHFLKCHSKNNDPGDDNTRVWRCAFEPNPLNSDETTSIVATCGGDSICLIDCNTGKLMRKYRTHQEDFYALAWTTVCLDVSGNERPTNLLAVAGMRGEIRMLYPSQLVCYSLLRDYKRSINTLIFHPQKPTWLFSGSRDVIVLWDIGIPKLPEYKCHSKKILSFEAYSTILNMVVLPEQDKLIGACVDGIYSWKIGGKCNKKKRPITTEYVLPACQPGDNVFVDGLALLQDDFLVTKYCVEKDDSYESDDRIHIWGVKDTESNCCHSNAFKRRDVKILHSLEWLHIKEIYLYLACRKESGVIAAGDNNGNIYIYDVSNAVGLETDSSIKHHEVLQWPSGIFDDEDKAILINDVGISSDLRTVVSVTQNNLVCIWKAL